MTTEVVWQPSAEDGNTAAVAVVVVAKAMAEGGGVGGQWGSGRDRSDSRHGVQRSLPTVIDNHRSTGESWSNTSPNNDGRGGSGGGDRCGSGGKKNCHTPSSYRWRTVILTDCTDSLSGVLDVIHYRRPPCQQQRRRRRRRRQHISF
jgi:hypothetical protein